MRHVMGGLLLGAAVVAGAPTGLLAHGGHVGGHEGPFGVFHLIAEPGALSVAVALLAVIAGVGVVLARLRSRV